MPDPTPTVEGLPSLEHLATLDEYEFGSYAPQILSALAALREQNQELRALVRGGIRALLGEAPRKTAGTQ